MENRFVVFPDLDERLLSGEARPRLRELGVGVLRRRERRVDVAVEEVRRAADDRDRQDADDDDRRDQHGHPRFPGAPRRSIGLNPASWHQRFASSAQAWSLSLSHNGMAARNSSRAAARLPALSASFPSSTCARPCTHLRPSLAIASLQLGARLRRGPARRAPRRACSATRRVFAEHARTPVVREARHAVVEDAHGVRRPAGTQQRRAVLEPHQAIARIGLPQRRQLLQRVVVPFLAVVQQHEREARVGLVLAADTRRLLPPAEDRARVRRRSPRRTRPSGPAATASRRCTDMCRRRGRRPSVAAPATGPVRVRRTPRARRGTRPARCPRPWPYTRRVTRLPRRAGSAHRRREDSPRCALRAIPIALSIASRKAATVSGGGGGSGDAVGLFGRPR